MNFLTDFLIPFFGGAISYYCMFKIWPIQTEIRSFTLYGKWLLVVLPVLIGTAF